MRKCWLLYGDKSRFQNSCNYFLLIIATYLSTKVLTVLYGMTIIFIGLIQFSNFFFASLLVLFPPYSNDLYLKMYISENGTRLFFFKYLGFKIKWGFHNQFFCDSSCIEFMITSQFCRVVALKINIPPTLTEVNQN